jgi:hypothetical protein
MIGVKRIVSGCFDPIRPIMLNGFHGLCRMTRENYRIVSCLGLQPVNINGSCFDLPYTSSESPRVDSQTRFAIPR